MRALVAYIVRGRVEAVTTSSVCAALSLLLPPFSYVSGAVVGLATLRNGSTEGGVIIGGSTLLAGAFIWLVLGTPYPVLLFALMTWLPLWGLAAVLRLTGSQGAAVALAGAFGALVVLGFHLTLGEPAAWWRELLEQLVGGAFEGSGLNADRARVAGFLDAWAPVMTGFVGAAIVLGVVLSLFLARWWHGLLDNPGGFGREFRALRLDRRVAVAAAVVGVTALLANELSGGLAADLLGPIVALFLFQGLAVAHAVVAGRSASVWWLVALYALLALVPPHLVLLLALVGYADTWVDFRTRWA